MSNGQSRADVGVRHSGSTLPHSVQTGLVPIG